MRLCVDRLSTSWRKRERGRGQTDSVAMPLPSNIPLPIPTSHLSPIRLCLVPCALSVPTPGAYPPASMNDRLTGWAVRWVSTWVLPLSSVCRI